MADVNYDRYAGEAAPRPRQGGRAQGAQGQGGRRQGGPGRGGAQGRRMLNLLGAAASLALLLGAGVWGYKIAVRNVLGIPVIKAVEGPMRVAPENPGGEVTAHQGLSVNDVAAVGVATPLPDEIVLAPRPVDLAAEDGPGLAPEPPAELLAPVAQEPVALPAADGVAEAAITDLPLDPLTTVAPLGDEAGAGAPADVLALADSLAAGAAPLSAPEAGSEAAPVVAGGLGRSIRPLARPGALAGAAVPSATDAAVAAALGIAAREVDPAALALGTRLVQFGAFDSEDEARAAWDRIAGRFGELMAGKGRVVQAAESGGRTFYRLRAEGFADEADARRFCAALTAESTDCIPVTLR